MKKLLAINAMLVTVIFCGCQFQKPQKENAIIKEYQGLKFSKQMGISDIYDTTRYYKAMFVKDSVCFKYATDGKFNVGDIIQSEQ